MSQDSTAVRDGRILDEIATYRHRHASTTADLPIGPGVEAWSELIGLADAAPARIAAAASADVLHVPYTYFPDAVGGTEVYVAGLAEALRPLGVHSAIAAPGEVDDAYLHDDVPVFRFATERGADLDRAYGAPDPRAAQSFRALIARLRPRIVHLHAHTAAVSARLVDAAHDAGAKVVFTYHTPTVSCARGTMMWMGRAPCDGKLDRRRCTLCTLAQHGVPPLLRDAIARTPPAIGDALGQAGLAGGAFTALRLSSLIGADHRRFAELAHKVDRIVAPCHWVRDVLRRNGVPEAKLVLCRQGLTRHAGPQGVPLSDPNPSARARWLRLGYFGRLDPTKGVDIVVEALRRVPNAPVRFEIYGIRQPGCEAYAAKLERAAATDPRIALLAALLPDAVGEAMRRCDLIVVPSRWLETGPLVVLEAFAAGTPVLGARLGGIAELVSDRVDGLLMPPEDPGAWASAIAALAAAPERIARLRARDPSAADDGRCGARHGRTVPDTARRCAAAEFDRRKGGPRRVLFIQATEPAGYPPLIHASSLMAEAGWEVTFLSAPIEGNRLELPRHPRIAVRAIPTRPSHVMGKAAYARYAAAAARLALQSAPGCRLRLRSAGGGARAARGAARPRPPRLPRARQPGPGFVAPLAGAGARRSSTTGRARHFSE